MERKITMKFIAILLGLVLMFCSTSSVPMDTGENIVTAQAEIPNEKFVAEVRDYFKEQEGENLVERNARETSDDLYSGDGVPLLHTKHAALNSGDTVAFQTHVRHLWLSCSGHLCDRHPCPRMRMTGSDWTNCWGEVFQIYRASGPGQVCVGDLVGIYYPQLAGRWLGCTGSTCPTSSCPGQPTTKHGFASEEHWYTCCEEVFKIYAYGKSIGTAINSGDDIMLYSLDQGHWVAQEDRSATTTTCAGTMRPPSIDEFDRCYKETFKIWKKP